MGEKEFNTIYLNNISLVKGYLYTHVNNRNDVEDLTQEVFLRVLLTKKEIKDIRSYLFIISKNLINKYNIEKSRYFRKIPDGNYYQVELSFDAILSFFNDLLTREEKEIITFHLQDDMPFEMIARKKNVTINQVAFYYYHGIQKIKKQIF